MEIKKGMWVRTESGYIDKIVDIKYNDNYNTEPTTVLLKNTKGCISYFKRNVERDENGNITRISESSQKHYHHISDMIDAKENVCDLIHVGDYVNGGRVTFVMSGCYVVIEENGSVKMICEEDIKTVVTKELFEKVTSYIEE